MGAARRRLGAERFDRVEQAGEHLLRVGVGDCAGVVAVVLAEDFVVR